MDVNKYMIEQFDNQFGKYFTDEKKIEFQTSLENWDLNLEEFMKYLDENYIFQACALGCKFDM